jgi:hypothetical protein
MLDLVVFIELASAPRKGAIPMPAAIIVAAIKTVSSFFVVAII